MFTQPIVEEPVTTSLPHSRESEEALAGALIINPGVYAEVSPYLVENDFYVHRLRWLYTAVGRLIGRGEAVDVVTITDELHDMGRLDELGGPAFLTALADRCPSTLNADTYAKNILDYSIKRTLLTVANHTAEGSYNGKTAKSILSEAQASIDRLSARVGDMETDLVSFRDGLSENYDAVDYASRHPDERGVETPWIDLNKILRYGWKARFYIVAGRPGTGKSRFLENVAYHAAYIKHKRVVYFCQEMSRNEIITRIISRHTGIDSQIIENGEMTPEQWPLYNQAIGDLDKMDFYIIDTPGLSPLQMRAKCRKISDRWGGIDIVIEDYLQLQAIDPNEKVSTRAMENRTQEVAYVSRQLKLLSRSLNCPVLAAAQLNRAVEQRAEKRPFLSDLKESGSLEQDANVVMFLWKDDEPQNQNITHCTIAKNRHGPVGELDLLTYANRFTSVASHTIDLNGV